MENVENTISTQDVSNAYVCYFFMSYLVLMSRSTAFSHPFIKAHARYAAFFHSIVLLTLVLSLYLFVFGNHSLDLSEWIIGIGVIQILSSFIVIVCFGALIYGIIQASKKQIPKISHIKKMTQKKWFSVRTEKNPDSLTEMDVFITILSYVPFLWIWIVHNHLHLPETRIWSRVGTVYGCLLLLISLQLAPGQNSLIMGLILLYIVALGIRGALLYMNKDAMNKKSIPLFLPSLSVVYAFIRCIPEFILSFAKIASWKQEHFYIQKSILNRQMLDEKEELLFKQSDAEKKTLPHPEIIYVPGISLLFLPRLFWNKKSVYSRAIIQSNVLLLLIFIFWWQQVGGGFYGFLWFFYVLGALHVRQKPGYKIPLIYELSQILGIFWRFIPKSKTKD